jgi:hypothetical protein
MCRREWECHRWDGEVTLEELRAQQPAPLFYISLAFLVSLCCGIPGVLGGGHPCLRKFGLCVKPEGLMQGWFVCVCVCGVFGVEHGCRCFT